MFHELCKGIKYVSYLLMSKYTLLDDSQLVALTQASNDRCAFSVLVNHHQTNLFSFIYRYTNEKYLADDITQDTFIKAYEKISRFEGKSKFKTWLFSIAYREFLQSKRKESRLQHTLNRFKQNTSQKYLSKLDDSIDISNALNYLNNNQKAVLLLCDASGMSHSEASLVLKIPLGSLKTYIKQARTIMQNQLEKNNE